MTTEDLERQILQDELSDRAEVFGRITPIEYARLVGVAPQRIYYLIRNKRLAYDECPECGRRTISVGEADKVFRPDTEAEEEDTGQSVLFDSPES